MRAFTKATLLIVVLMLGVTTTHAFYGGTVSAALPPTVEVIAAARTSLTVQYLGRDVSYHLYSFDAAETPTVVFIVPKPPKGTRRMVLELDSQLISSQGAADAKLRITSGTDMAEVSCGGVTPVCRLVFDVVP